MTSADQLTRSEAYISGVDRQVINRAGCWPVVSVVWSMVYCPPFVLHKQDPEGVTVCDFMID